MGSEKVPIQILQIQRGMQVLWIGDKEVGAMAVSPKAVVHAATAVIVPIRKRRLIRNWQKWLNPHSLATIAGMMKMGESV